MKCEKLTTFEICYRKQRTVVHAHTAECGRPKRVNEMYIRIRTMLSKVRLLTTSLFICESEANAHLCFALKGKEKVGASEVKTPRIFGVDDNE
jgi:hypothetical protein